MPAEVLRRARGAPTLDARKVKRIAERMLRSLELEHAELSVLLTDDEGIRELNREFRSKDKPTDVLSFPLDESDGDAGPDGVRQLGDVVISLDTAARQARGRRRELLAEVRFLLAHGLAHLLGYDHATPPEKREMDAMTRFLVRSGLGPSAGAGSRSARGPKGPRKRLGSLRALD